MKIVGAMVVGPGEADRWLKPCLEQFKILDGALIVQNNTDVKTKEVIRESGFKSYEDNREWGKLQFKIKEDLVRRLGDLKPDWVIFLDADEFLDKRLTREKLEELASKPHDIAYYFWCVELWDSADQYRTDFTFEDVRFWKYLPRLLSFRRTPVHCGMAPEFNYRWGTRSEYFFKHYGLLRQEDRIKKVERYNKYDSTGKYLPKEWYQALLAKNPPLGQLSGPSFLKDVPKTLFRKKPVPTVQNIQPKKIWRFINAHGQLIILDQERHYRAALTRQGMTFLGEEIIEDIINPVTSSSDAPIVEMTSEEQPKLERAENECDICGFIGQTPRAVKIHKSRQHK